MHGLLEYFQQRQKRCREQLELAQTPGFSIRQAVPGFPDADITEQYRTSLRVAIDDYERAIKYMHETGAQ